MAEQDKSLHYFTNVGVNTSVTVQLSFLNQSERRCTHTVAGTFCPDFDHHMEFACNLLLRSSSGETRSLAEELQVAFAIFTLWNRDSRTGSVIILLYLSLALPRVRLRYLSEFSYYVLSKVEEKLTCGSEDVMLGKVKIPLIDLIHKRTGKPHSTIASSERFSYVIQLLYFFFSNIKVFLGGLEYIYTRKKVLLNTSKSSLEDSMSPLDLPTIQTGKK